MGYMANKAHRVWGTGVWGTGGMGHMGNRPQWVQGYRVQGVWGTGVWDTGGMGHMGNGPHGQWSTWAMGHMGNGTHGQCGPMGDWDIFVYNFIITGWILTKILLDIDIDVFYLNTG